LRIGREETAFEYVSNQKKTEAAVLVTTDMGVEVTGPGRRLT
jgi:hypothetical protein